MKAAMSYTSAKIRVILDGREVTQEATTVLVGNVKNYGGPFQITHKAACDDGLLDVCFVTGKSFWSWARYVWGMFRRRLDTYSDVQYWRAREIVLESDQEVPVQMDGDFCGTLPVQIHVVPKRTALLVPA